MLVICIWQCFLVCCAEIPCVEKQNKQIIDNYIKLVNNMLCVVNNLAISFSSFKIRGLKTSLKKREKDMLKVQLIIYWLSTKEKCHIEVGCRALFSEFQHSTAEHVERRGESSFVNLLFGINGVDTERIIVAFSKWLRYSQ